MTAEVARDHDGDGAGDPPPLLVGLVVVANDQEQKRKGQGSDNKYNLKRDYSKAKGGDPAVDAIRRQPPLNIEQMSFGSTHRTCTEC
ncbi:hypothetical protein Tco_1549504 [Tanacetum coccineum]